MYSDRWQTGKSSGIKNVYPFTKPVPGSYCEAFLRAQEHLVHQRDNVSSDDTCSKTMFCNSLSSNASVEQNLTALDLSDDQNGVIYNRPKQSIHYIPNVRRQTKLKKVVASGVIVQGKKNFYGQIYKQKQTNIDTIESNNSHSLHLSNEECTNNSILPKTADLSSISVKENKRIDNRIDKNTRTLGNLLKEDIQKVPGTKKKKRTSGETSNSLRQDDKQTEIDNLIDKTNTLFVDDMNDIFALPRLFHFPNIAKHDVRDANDNTSISTLSSSTEDIKIACCEEEKKKRNRKVCNFPQKNDKQTDLKRDILENETHSTQLNNCNNDSPKIVSLPNINAVKHESTQDTNDKDISALQSSELMFFDIDYEFHEANHAIIQTFALNIYLFQCTNEKKTYCLVCDTTFQIPNKRSLQKILSKHIKSDDHVKLLSQMIEDDKKCLKAGKRFSKLGLAREYMRSKGDVIECLLCDSMNFVSKLQNDDLLIDEHISSSLHQNFKVSWKWPVKKILGDVKYRFRNMYNAKKYCCEFCKYENKSEIYFTKHLRVSYHTSRLAEIADYAEIFKFHYCGACLLLWFGHSDMYERHCEQSEHKRKITYGVELDNDNTSISTLSSSTEDIKIACCEEEKKKRNRKVCNFPQKNDKQTDLKRDILENETHSTQLNNCNNDSPKIVNLPNINAVKHESTQDTNDKDISALQSSELMFFDIDYEFHEANHAIIQTFALNIYLFQCTNEKKTYCLVCDTTFQIPNKRSLQKILSKHIKSDDHVKLLSRMIEDDKKCLKAGKRFSKLGLAREYMRSKGDVIECLLCDSMNFVSKLQNDDLLIDEHISSSLHQNFKVSWKWPVKKILGDVKYRFRNMYNAKKYCCEFCKYENKSEIYFTKHLRVSYHTSRLAEIADYAEIFKFHYCGVCLLLWFGHSDMYERHCEQSEHKRKITYGVEFDNLSEEVFQLLVMCNKNAETLLAQSNSVCNDQIIGYILWDLITDVQKSLPNVKAYPFGSRISDLAFSNSDIDIFLDYDDIYGKKLSHQDCQNLLTFIVNYLSLNKTMWKIQEMILNSRTPIIKVQHIPSKFICDISVTNGLAVENTKLIKCFNHAFSPCRKMVLFLKKWLNSCGLLHSNLITSYALTWCVIFYLQTLLVFPSISQLIKLKNSSWRIGGWEVGVSYDFPVKRINHTFEELLFGFFMFYANFTYKTHVICPLLGQPIKKSVFTNLSSLPPEMAPYIAYMRDACVEKKSQIFSISSLCVQDPFDLSHNLTKAMNNRKLNQFQSNCKYSAKILEKTFPNLKQPLSS